jgi:hypothetical protein
VGRSETCFARCPGSTRRTNRTRVFWSTAEMSADGEDSKSRRSVDPSLDPETARRHTVARGGGTSVTASSDSVEARTLSGTRLATLSETSLPDGERGTRPGPRTAIGSPAAANARVESAEVRSAVDRFRCRRSRGSPTSTFDFRRGCVQRSVGSASPDTRAALGATVAYRDQSRIVSIACSKCTPGTLTTGLIPWRRAASTGKPSCRATTVAVGGGPGAVGHRVSHARVLRSVIAPWWDRSGGD